MRILDEPESVGSVIKKIFGSSENLYRSLFEALSAGIAVIDHKGNLVFVNKTFAEGLGFERHEIEKIKNISDFVHPDDLPGIQEFIEADNTVAHNTGDTKEITITDRFGISHEIIVSASRIPGTTHYVISGQDIADTLKEAEATRNSLDLYRTIFEATGNGTLILEEDGTVLLANSTFCRMMGYSRDQIEGKMLLFDFVHTDDRKRTQHYHRLRRANPESAPSNYEVRFIDGRGNVHDIMVTAALIPGTNQSVISGMDITCENKAVYELEKKAEILKIALESVKEGLMDWDLHTDEIRLSATFYEMLGYDPVTFKQGIQSWKSLLHPDDIEGVLEKMDSVRSGCSFIEMEFRMKSADNSWRWIFNRGKTIDSDEFGNPKRFVGIFIDISDRKHSEERLRKNEAKYRALFEESPVPMWRIDLSDVRSCIDILSECGVDDIGRYLENKTRVLSNFLSMITIKETNRACERMFGTNSKDEIISNLHLLLPENSLYLLKNAIVALLAQNDTFEEEIIIRTLEGDKRNCIVHLSLLPGSELTWKTIIVSFIDITKTKQIEENLKKSEENFRLIVETAPSLLIILNNEGIVTYISPNSEQIVGYSQEEILDKPIIWVDEQDKSRVKEVLEKTFANGLGYRDFEYRAVKKSGDLWMASGSWEPLMDNAGNLSGLVMQVIDITDRKTAEEALKESEERFRRIISNVNDAIYRYEFHPEGHYSYMSSNITAITGYSPEDYYRNPLIYEEIVHPEDLPLIEMVMQAKVSWGVPVILRWELKNGTTIWTEECDFPIYDDDGLLCGFEGVIRDITARKTVENALRESEERYRALVESNPEPTIVHSEGKFLYANSAALKLFGAADSIDIVGRSLLEFIHEDYRALEEKRINRSYVDRRISPLIEEKMYRLDGSVLSIEVASVPIAFNGKRATQEVIRDISHRKEVEKTIISHNRQLSIINQVIRVANSSLILEEMLEIVLEMTVKLLEFDMGWIYIKTTEGTVANLAAAFGISETFIDRNGTIFIRDFPYNVIFFGNQARFIENTPEDPAGMIEARILEDIDAMTFAGIPLVADSVVVGALFIGKRSVHRFRDQEKSILESIGKEIGGTVLRGMLQEELENAYEETNCYLDIMENDIKSANDALLEYAKVVKEMLTGPAERFAGKLEEVILQSNEIISNVSTIRRLAGEPIDLGPVDLDAVILAEMKNFPKNSIFYNEAGHVVIADDLLSDIFANLFGNSIKFGGSDVKIWVKCEEKDGLIEITVEDSGPGIPDERKNCIFSYFSLTSQKPSGRGLGLHICRILLERYCGKIWAEDRVPGRPSEGLAIRFTLAPYSE